MTSPLIGITSNYSSMPLSLLTSSTLQRSYISAVIRAGGLPVIIPSDITEAGWKELVTRLDGILFSGGGDISLDNFEGEEHPAIDGIEPPRDAIEIGMVREAVASAKPFLGICRGLQSVNVALGGTLYTHIPAQVPNSLVHNQPSGGDWHNRTVLSHTVSIQPGSYLAKLTGETEMGVNSFHHQGLGQIANGFKVVGRASDGVVEAIESVDSAFIFGVQWHPEDMYSTDVNMLNLFKMFVDNLS